MPISNDGELAGAVAEASSLIQEIQDYVGRNFSRPARIRFPRGYLRTAAQTRRRFDFLRDARLIRNIAYTVQLADVQHWLLTRTDLAGIARGMVIKLQMFLLGTIIESITRECLRDRCGGNFCRRTQYLLDNGLIEAELKDDIDWLWGIRNRMHLFQLEQIEWLSTDYTVENLNRAVRAFQVLLNSLNAS